MVKEQLKPIHFSDEPVNEEMEPLLAPVPRGRNKSRRLPVFHCKLGKSSSLRIERWMPRSKKTWIRVALSVAHGLTLGHPRVQFGLTDNYSKKTVNYLLNFSFFFLITLCTVSQSAGDSANTHLNKSIQSNRCLLLPRFSTISFSFGPPSEKVLSEILHFPQCSTVACFVWPSMPPTNHMLKKLSKKM